MFTEFQKKIIIEILNYKPDVVEVKFKDLFQHILNSYFENISVMLTSKEIKLGFLKKIGNEEILKIKNNFNELIFLFEKLSKEYDFFYNSEFHNEEQSFKFNIKDKSNNFIAFKNEKIGFIFKNLKSDYFVSSSLYELKEREFMSVELKNLKLTQKLLTWTIILGFLPLLFEIYKTYCIKNSNNIIPIIVSIIFK